MVLLVAVAFALLAIGLAALVTFVALVACRHASEQLVAANQRAADADTRRDRALELLTEAERARDRDRREFITRLETWSAMFTDAIALYREAVAEVTGVARVDEPRRTPKGRIQ